VESLLGERHGTAIADEAKASTPTMQTSLFIAFLLSKNRNALFALILQAHSRRRWIPAVEIVSVQKRRSDAFAPPALVRVLRCPARWGLFHPPRSHHVNRSKPGMSTG
jgi:hypothetical protein